MRFGEKLAIYLEKNGIEQKELAQLLGVTEQTVSAYITKKNNPTYTRFVQICTQLKIDANYFMDDYDELTNITPKLNPEDQYILDHYKALTPHDKEIVDHIFKLKPEGSIQYSDNTNKLINLGEIIFIDTYPQPVSAGKGNIYIDDNPVPKLYPSTPTSSKANYCVRISGESMYPNYLDGDYVYVDTKIKDLNNADIGIFFYDGEAYCKKYYKDKNIKKLISLNPNQERYNPIIIENNTFEVQGKVIGKFHAD